MVKIDITIRSEKAARWQEVMESIEAELGYRPTRPEALGILMANYDDDLY